MAQLVGDEFAHVHGAGLEFERGQRLGRNHVAQVGENGAIPGHGEAVTQ